MLIRKQVRVVPLLCALAVSIAGCSGSDEKESNEPRDQQRSKAAEMVRVETTCGGIFDKEAVADSKDHSGPKLVRPGKVESPSEAARMLGEETDLGTDHRLCFLGEENGGNLMELSVAWATDRVPKGKSVKYEFTDPPGNADTALKVRCQLDGNTNSQDHALGFYLLDLFTVSGRSHATLLAAAAQKVTAQMDCGEQPDYPDRPADVAPPADKGTDTDGDGDIDRVPR